MEIWWRGMLWKYIRMLHLCIHLVQQEIQNTLDGYAFVYIVKLVISLMKMWILHSSLVQVIFVVQRCSSNTNQNTLDGCVHVLRFLFFNWIIKLVLSNSPIVWQCFLFFFINWGVVCTQAKQNYHKEEFLIACDRDLSQYKLIKVKGGLAWINRQEWLI